MLRLSFSQMKKDKLSLDLLHQLFSGNFRSKLQVIHVSKENIVKNRNQGSYCVLRFETEAVTTDKVFALIRQSWQSSSLYSCTKRRQ